MIYLIDAESCSWPMISKNGVEAFFVTPTEQSERRGKKKSGFRTLLNQVPGALKAQEYTKRDSDMRRFLKIRICVCVSDLICLPILCTFYPKSRRKTAFVFLVCFLRKTNKKGYLKEPKNVPTNPPMMKSRVPVMMIREAKKTKTPTIMRPV